MLYALIDTRSAPAAGAVLRYEAMAAPPPALAEAKGLAWRPVTETRAPLAAGEAHGEPVVTVSADAVSRHWPAVPYRPPVPATVSRAQARVALMRAGLLEPVDAAVTALGPEAVALWTGAVEVTRHGALVAAVAGALGWTAEQLDDLFRTAAGIAG